MLLCAVACGLMQYFTPWQLDDLGYGHACREAMLGGPPSVSWSDGVAWFKMHWATINGRFGDKLMLWMLGDLPKWGIACGAGLCCLSLFWFASMLAFGSVRRHPVRSVILTAILNCLLPWAGYIFFASMFLNYGAGAAITAIAVYLFIRTPQRVASPRLLPLIFLVALMAGWWHEIYCVPALCGMVVFMLMPGVKIDKVRLTVFVATVLALVLILSAPGFWTRRAMTPVTPEAVGLLTIAKSISVNILIVPLTPAIFLIPSWRRRFSPLQKASALFACTVLAATTFIYIVSMHEHRVFWYAGTIVMPVLCMLAAPLFGFLSAGIKRLCSWGCILFLIAHYVPTILLQRSLNSEYQEIISAYRQSPDGVVFYDFHGRNFGPWITLRKARVCAFNYEMRAPLPFYRNDLTRLSLVPTILRDFDPSLFSAPAQTIVYKGCVVSNDSSLRDSTEVIFVRFTFSDGHTDIFPTTINGFKAADGSEIFYLEPDERHTGGRTIISASLE